MNTKTFPNGLVVKNRKSAIIFEDCHPKDVNQDKFIYTFNKNEFKEFINYMVSIANESWKNIIPKIATSMGSDYYEYYDRKYDNNGTLSINQPDNDDIIITIHAPFYSKDTLYQFNKPKIQSFIWDCQNDILY